MQKHTETWHPGHPPHEYIHPCKSTISSFTYMDICVSVYGCVDYCIFPVFHHIEMSAFMQVYV